MNLDKILKLSNLRLEEKICKELQFRTEKVCQSDDCLKIAGKIPVLLIGSICSVHDFPPVEICKSKQTWMAPGGIGGENRCGVYSILQVLCYNSCSVMLANGKMSPEKMQQQLTEYVSAHGIKCIIDFSLPGGDNCILSGNGSNLNSLVSIAAEAGFNIYAGDSDFPLEPGTTLIHVSTGYHDTNTNCERIDIDEMWKTIRLVEKFIGFFERKSAAVENSASSEDTSVKNCVRIEAQQERSLA